MWTRNDIEAVYRRYSYAVYRRCRSLLHNESEAKDAAQEVFLSILERPDAFRGQAQPGTYLYAIATRHCLNRIRNSRARGAAWLTRLNNHIAVSARAEGSESSIQARAIVRTILGEADEVTACIAVYHFCDGMSQQEIADLVGLSRVSVNRRLAQLKEQVQRRAASEEARREEVSR